MPAMPSDLPGRAVLERVGQPLATDHDAAEAPGSARLDHEEEPLYVGEVADLVEADPG
jgi:hypothetical protein